MLNENFRNSIKTVVLLGLLTALLLWAGGRFGMSGLMIAAIIVFIMNFGVYFYSDKLVLRMYNAKEVKKSDYPGLWKIVKKVAGEAKIPMPKVFVIESNNPNAFATGRNPKHAAIAVTTGVMNLLGNNELEGVIAHEMAHIKNRDILIATAAATIAGIISYLAVMARWAAIFGAGSRDDQGGNLLELLVLVIIVPVMAMLIRLAISRSREFAADAKGAIFIKNPDNLANALEKLELGTKAHPMGNRSESTASLFIVNPFSAKNAIRWFSTHPPTKERIAKLRSMQVMK